jgi:hypothetical protein
MSITQINLTNQVKDNSLTNVKIIDNEITNAKLKDLTIDNTKISESAQIAISKLNTASPAAFDSTGALKTAADAPVNNANVSATAGIVYSKLNFQEGAVGHIVNGDIASNAAIATSKLAADTANRAAVTDANGFLGASTVLTTELNQLAGISTGSTIQTQINGKVAKSGDSMTGNLAMNGFTITGLKTTPSDSNEAATKAYVDNLISGLTFRPAAEAIDVLNHTDTPPATPMLGQHYISLTGGVLYYWNGASWVDSGDVLAAGKYYVISKVPTALGAFDGRGNNIAKWSGTSWSFETPVDGWAIFIRDGYYTSNGYVYEASSNLWNQFSGAGQINAGIGLNKNGNTMDVNLGAGIKELPTDEIGIDLYTNGGLILTQNGVDSSADSAAQLRVIADGSTVAIGAQGVYLPADGVTKTQINADVAGIGLVQDTDGSLRVNTDGATLETNLDVVRVKAKGINDTHIDWGTGVNQVSTTDVPEGSQQYFLPNRACDAVGAILTDSTSIGFSYTSASALTAAVKVDDATIEIDGTNQHVQIKAAGINATHLSGSVAGDGIGGGNGTALNIAAGTGIVVNPDGVAVDVGTTATKIPQFNSDNQIRLSDGTALLPALTFASDLNTGLWNNGTDNIAVSTNGIQRLNISTAVITSALPIAMGNNGISGVNTILNAYGSQAACAYAFTGDAGTGMFGISTNTLALATGGSERLRVASNGYVGIGKTPSLSILDVNGTVTATAFSGDGTNVTNVNADTVNALHASSFLRTDANSAVSASNVLTINDGATLAITTAGDWTIGGTAVMSTAAQLNALGTMVDYEIPSGTKNGVNQTFTIAHTPIAGSIRLYKNGAAQLLDPAKDFTISGNTLMINLPPVSTDDLWVHYRW